MHGKLLIFFIFCTTVATAKKLPVTLYYESLCPDSVRFVTKQLHPTFKDAGKYLDLDLVPFGFATADNSSGHWEFICQHGAVECYNNKVHSCVIAHNSIAASVEFIYCAMKSKPSNETLTLCANLTNISWESIESCLSSGEADILLVENGRKTNMVIPSISYIPTIIFNGIYNKALQVEAEHNFLKVICLLLKNKPDICKYLGIIQNLII
ncbi:GILT-like protein 1 [Zophobas morio]|uniref:GILT-like protein 1 n=1 Tax=Zophobas morio TaxID=2755281 RepID=UPI003083E7C2